MDTVTLTGGGTLEFFINGVSRATVAVGSTGTQTERFGFNRFDDPTWWSNNMADATSIFKRVLTGTEITTLYNAGAGLQYPWTVTPPTANTGSGFFMM